ncbi:MAG: response regulator [Calditrichaceae bacterium]|nr:response regulator [Calditrichaceae bacterium]
MKKNVLIVDDFEPNLLVLESILEDLPISIIKAVNGEDALRILLNQPIDLILLDIKLPDINGYEVARMIRKHKKSKSMPIIFLSGFVDQEYSEFIEEYSNNIDFFQKPFDSDELRKQVKHYLNHK